MSVRYTCPGCGAVSDPQPTNAAADQLLAIHRRHFCTPRPKRTRRTTGTGAR